MEKAQLLAEIEDTLRRMPPRATIRHETTENLDWFGRVSAVIEKWNPSKSVLVKEYCNLFFSNGHVQDEEFRERLTFREPPSRHAGNIPYLLDSTREPSALNMLLRLFRIRVSALGHRYKALPAYPWD